MDDVVYVAEELPFAAIRKVPYVQVWAYGVKLKAVSLEGKTLRATIAELSRKYAVYGCFVFWRYETGVTDAGKSVSLKSKPYKISSHDVVNGRIGKSY